MEAGDVVRSLFVQQVAGVPYDGEANRGDSLHEVPLARQRNARSEAPAMRSTGTLSFGSSAATASMSQFASMARDAGHVHGVFGESVVGVDPLVVEDRAEAPDHTLHARARLFTRRSMTSDAAARSRAAGTESARTTPRAA